MSAYRGVRIADFSQGTAGPMAAMFLGDFEAEVIKVEPTGGERGRDHPGYHAFNRNKRVLTLDLGTPAGLAAARELIAGADVALFSEPPGRLEALGLDATSLRADQPGLIHAWMPPYGVTGAWSQLPPHHSLLSALSGVAFRQGAYGDQPIHLVLPLIWYGQGVLGASAIGAALLERQRSGQGQAVVVSGLNALSEVSGPVRVLAAPPLPRGQPLGASPSYRLYQCGDGQWFFLGCLFANFYLKCFEAVGIADRWDELALDPLLARDTLMSLFRARPRTEWLQVLQDHGVPCAPVGPREAWFAGEAVANGDLRTTLIHPRLGDVAVPAPPARLSGTPASIRHLAQPIAAPPAWASRPPPAASGEAEAAAPLDGIRVLDLGTVIAGAHAGGVLANLGADVVKIEPVEGDPFRSDGGGFLAYNRGKRGLGLDLKQPAGRELFYDVVRQADVVLDNYRFGVRARLGIDYATLKAINPRIVSCSINAYGDKGPRAALPGFDPLLQAEGGMQQGQGGDDEPILHTIPVNDVATAAVVSMAVVAALNARMRTGEGQEIVTSLMAQSLTFQLAEVVDYAGRPPNDLGGRDCLGPRALHRFYQCADGWLALVCDTPEAARGLAGVLGLEVGDAPLAAPRDGPLAGAIARALIVRPRDAAVQALLAAGVAAAPALRAAEAMESDWLWENRALEIWRHPRLGDVCGVRSYADFSRTPAGFRRPTPDLGEQSSAILRELGVAEDRIAGLLATGAIFEPVHIDPARAKSARAGNDNAALSVQ
ncbi:CoA transferase [Phenylobacterium sp.]|uniref:CaiB/BaiF CoA transferase family protein n=1 Tax=Phenylobacterium sp. TaxID=1871053 RepID=UPI0025FD0D39|nr:CoA transferase [Phenylobacterium sp.]